MRETARSQNPGDRNCALLLLTAAVLLRAVFPLFIDGANYDGLLPGPEANRDAYRLALRKEPFGYLLYDHVLPILFTAKNAVLHNLLDGEWAIVAGYGTLVVVDGLTAMLAFLFLRLFAVIRPLAVAVAAAVSLRLLPWEAIYWGGGWDSFNPFLVMLYSWAIARLMLSPDPGKAWTAGICGLLLVTGFQFGLPIVAATCAGAAILVLGKRGWTIPLVALFLLPGVVTVTIVAKNVTQHGLWSMSSGAGQNIFQNLNMALSDENGRGGQKFGMARGYPNWWVWCYDEAERRNAHHVPNVAGFYGACMMNPDGSRDFTALKKIFHDHPDPHMNALLERDLEIQANRPWLWDSPVAFRATGISLEYGKISQRLLPDIAAAYPRRFAGRTWLNLTRHFLWETWHYLVDRNRISFEETGPVRFLNRIFGLLFPVGFAAAGVYFAAVGFRRLAALISRHAAGPTPRLRALGLVATGFLAIAAVSSAMACCENHRHAFCYLPVAFCLGTILIRDGLSEIGRIPQLRRLR